VHPRRRAISLSTAPTAGGRQNLKAKINRDHWVEDKGWLAMGLDREKRPIDALSSNMCHCLWTGILDAYKGTIVVKRLLFRDLFGRRSEEVPVTGLPDDIGLVDAPRHPPTGP
jgi:hypothetical protein